MKQRRNTRTAQRGGGKWGEGTGKYRTPESLNVEFKEKRGFNLFASVPVCLIGVWCLCLHGPPRGLFFSCKNGRSHDACIIGIKADGRLESESRLVLEYLRDDVLSWWFSCVLPWMFRSLCFHGLAFVYAPVCGVVCSLVRLSVSENSSVGPCGCVMQAHSKGWEGMIAMTTRLTPALIINVLCHSGDSSRLWRWDVLYW